MKPEYIKIGRFIAAPFAGCWYKFKIVGELTEAGCLPVEFLNDKLEPKGDYWALNRAQIEHSFYIPTPIEVAPSYALKSWTLTRLIRRIFGRNK